ncbi:WecB/TagA/CpsF family glycosyltransferase [Patescibacteria group bacterium]|nr:WecB/TagA/CpsF family glycosyltransferase [Patescibacteria group bacterium]MBU1890741.1 WecB/TagA/CpsF family glycosyltransferase [Patescibacteria group bacterium]
MNNIKILGITISSLGLDELRAVLLKYLKTDGSKQIVTPNPEFCVRAGRDFEFRNILNKADLAIPDGIGIKLAGLYLGTPIKKRITGIRLVRELCQIASDQKKKVYFLGATNKTALEAARNLKSKYSDMKVVGAENEYSVFGKMKDDKVVKKINQKKADILFVAFGAPKQEKWIYYNLPKMKSVKIAVGVGGAFDYYSGNVKRAPSLFRNIGLEWLYRLIRQPWRIKRIFTAIMVFPVKLFFKRKNHA